MENHPGGIIEEGHQIDLLQLLAGSNGQIASVLDVRVPELVTVPLLEPSGGQAPGS